MDVFWPVGLVPLVHGDEVAIIIGQWARGCIEFCLVGFARFDGLVHLVLDRQNGSLVM